MSEKTIEIADIANARDKAIESTSDFFVLAQEKLVAEADRFDRDYMDVFALIDGVSNNQEEWLHTLKSHLDSLYEEIRTEILEVIEVAESSTEGMHPEHDSEELEEILNMRKKQESLRKHPLYKESISSDPHESFLAYLKLDWCFKDRV